MEAERQGTRRQDPSNQPCPLFASKPDLELPTCGDCRIALLAISGVLVESNATGASALLAPTTPGSTTLLTWRRAVPMMQALG